MIYIEFAYGLVVTMLVNDKTMYTYYVLPAYFTNKATVQKGPRNRDYLIKNIM